MTPPVMRTMNDHAIIRYLVRQTSAKWPKSGYNKNAKPCRKSSKTLVSLTAKLKKNLLHGTLENCTSRQHAITTRSPRNSIAQSLIVN